MAPPLNGTALLPGGLTPVAVEGGGSVMLATGLGYGAVAADMVAGVAGAGVEDDGFEDVVGTMAVEEGEVAATPVLVEAAVAMATV